MLKRSFKVQFESVPLWESGVPSVISKYFLFPCVASSQMFWWYKEIP